MGRRRYRSHELDIYRSHVHVATDRGQWASLRRKITTLEDEPGLGFTQLHVFVPDRPGPHVPHVAVFVDVEAHGDNFCGLIETCAHEAVHVAAMLLDHLGEEYDGESEALAYLVGWATRWLWDACGDAIDPDLLP
jgi:hypothetical protein